MSASQACADFCPFVELLRLSLRGRKPSARIADCARTKIRPHEISDLVLIQPQAAPGFIQNRVFRADVLFIRAENAVGAQRAQWWIITFRRRGTTR
jgi:hypothetical protein